MGHFESFGKTDPLRVVRIGRVSPPKDHEKEFDRYPSRWSFMGTFFLGRN